MTFMFYNGVKIESDWFIKNQFIESKFTENQLIENELSGACLLKINLLNAQFIEKHVHRKRVVIIFWEVRLG